MLPTAFTPRAELRPFIKTFVFLEAEQEVENFLLPDTAMVWAIRYKGKVQMKEEGHYGAIPASIFSGVRKISKEVRYESCSGNLLVIFEPWGAAAFFKEPLHELYGVSLQLEHLHGYADMTSISEQLADIPGKTEQVAFIERILLSRLQGVKTDPLLVKAIQKITAGNGNLQVKKLTQELGISVDAFEKKFRKVVGASPKQYASILRLRYAVDHHQPGNSLTDTALAAGYYDQAHFIKDFTAFTGQTPLEFFRTTRFW